MYNLQTALLLQFYPARIENPKTKTKLERAGLCVLLICRSPQESLSLSLSEDESVRPAPRS